MSMVAELADAFDLPRGFKWRSVVRCGLHVLPDKLYSTLLVGAPRGACVPGEGRTQESRRRSRRFSPDGCGSSKQVDVWRPLPVKDIALPTSSLEEAHDVFGWRRRAGVEGYLQSVLRQQEGKDQAMPVPKEERKVEQFAGAHSKKVVRDSMDEVYGGGAAAKKGKKQKGKKQNKSKKVSLSHVMEELRVDPSDGNAYPRSSFMEVYGEFGQEHWEKALKVVDQEEPEPEVEVMSRSRGGRDSTGGC